MKHTNSTHHCNVKKHLCNYGENKFQLKIEGRFFKLLFLKSGRLDLLLVSVSA